MKYELIITEKPMAAAKIAYALGNPIKKSIVGVPYYELTRKGKKIVVACAAGHLFSLTTKQKKIPAFEIEWQPNSKTKKFYSAIKELTKNASSFIIAMDYDIEGELIGYNILRFICKKQGKRMKFSTLTKTELENSYENISDINFGMAKSGETRHILDFYYGINLSRALMNAIKKAGKFKILSVGRVQGPALAFIVQREKEISEFKPEPYWQIFVLASNAHEVELKYEKDIKKQGELAKFDLKGKKGFAETKKFEREIFPPFPFDLTTLQLEAYRFYGISPSRLLQIVQQLYLRGLISYPRTASQKLPPAIGYKRILEKLNATKFVKRAKPVEGKKTDVHPAIFPTGETAKLTNEQKKIYDLIVARFVSCFCENAKIEEKEIIARINGLKFFAKGLRIIEKGWMNVYRTRPEEKILPDLQGDVIIKKVRIEEKQTQPPRRYNQASLVAELARKNLGTKATRALIIDTLYERNYIKGNIEATPLGITLINTLQKEFPIIIDEKLTRHFESELEKIEKAKEEPKKVLDEAKGIISAITKEFEHKEEKIGKELLQGYEKMKEEEKIMLCRCKKGYLIIKKSKNGKQFLACSAYPKCKQTYSLPQYCLIKKTERQCECGFPLLVAIRKKRKPWEFCFNPNCARK